ncbi:MAG TPA: YihY/virulence factor BrkB family protein, partial [Acidimicrobiales bacterium]|nr:YihY/virulence factor BrkB family protein [Acidimicrobiales bacterium]
RADVTDRHGPNAAGDPSRTGPHALRPRGISARGWLGILRRVGAGLRRNHVPLLSAGVAFYAMVSLVPALIAVISVYGLVVTPAQAAHQVASVTSALPAEARQLLTKQLQAVAQADTGGLGVGLAAGLAGALWSASSGMRWMMTALSIVFEETETRRFVKLRAQAMLLTVGAVFALVVSLGMLVGLPAAFDAVGLPKPGRVIADIVRFPFLGLLVVVGLGVLYRVGPDRRQARRGWVSYGSLAGTTLWLLGSLGLSLYAANASHLKVTGTYGALSAVVVLLLWLFLTAFAVLLGAELDTEIERHMTVGDSAKLSGVELARPPRTATVLPTRQ